MKMETFNSGFLQRCLINNNTPLENNGGQEYYKTSGNHCQE